MKRGIAVLLCITLAVMLGVPALADEPPVVEPPAADYIETPEGGVYEEVSPEPSEPEPDNSPVEPLEPPESLPEETSSDPAAADSSSEESDRAESIPTESEPPPEEPAPEEPTPVQDNNQIMLVFGLGAVGGLMVAMLLLRGI